MAAAPPGPQGRLPPELGSTRLAPGRVNPRAPPLRELARAHHQAGDGAPLQAREPPHRPPPAPAPVPPHLRRVKGADLVPTKRRRGPGPALLPRGERLGQVAQDRWLAEDRRHDKRAPAGVGMMIARAVALVALAVTLLAAPLAAGAQQPDRKPLVRILDNGVPRLFAELREGLRQVGDVEGENIQLV